MRKASGQRASEHRFAYDGIDRVIHERARLGVLSALLAHPKGLPFSEVKRLCALTDGNLNRHLQVLSSARLVAITKGADRNRPQTVCRLTSFGRKRYAQYLRVLEQVILDAAAAVQYAPAGYALPGVTGQ